MVEVRRSDITLLDVIASQEIKTSIIEVINECKNKDILNNYGLESLNKILLSGPPGVGKTWTAMAIAGELEMDLVFVRWDSLISSYLGSTGSNIRKVFETVSAKPAVLLLDEFDAAGKDRGGDGQEVGEMSRVVINILQNIDMFSPESFFVAATNHGHLLDTAIPRRFVVVNMELPGEDERRRLIEYYSRGLPVSIDLDEWLKETGGLSGAEIRTRIHQEAKRVILKKNSDFMSVATL
ncbi:MAG: AAA family ATPase [Firmicutes bacterium]|nr:AAA family ATPase [Bacillota bacterium]